jgi:phosphate transport system substrate-binding protein
MWKKVLVGVMTTMMMGATAMASGSLTLGGSSSVYPLATLLGPQYNAAIPANPHIDFSFSSSDSGTGIADVAAGRVDIGNSSRELTSAEVASGLVSTRIAKDAVVMIVNPNNTAVKNLTPAQIQKIYNGTYQNWSDGDLGGDSAPIVVETRENGSGTLDFFTKTFMGTSTITNATTNNGSLAMHDAVAADPNAIGFIALGYVDSSVTALNLNGVAASVATAQNGTYTAVRNLNMITKGNPSGNAQLFLNWILTTAGQTCVQQDKEIPLITLNATKSLRATKNLRATRR